MPKELPETTPPTRRTRVFFATGGTLLFGTILLAIWATSDHGWEQNWRDRVRVETPLGLGKAYVLLWVRQNSEFLPHVESVCLDKLKDIPIVELAGVNSSAVASFARITVRRQDLLAGSRDNMRVYYFFDANDKVVAHYYLPFHELARFEQSFQRLASH